MELQLHLLPKLQRTVEFSYSKLNNIKISKESSYSSIWDNSVNHDEEDIHSFCIRYFAKTDSIQLVIMDVDGDDYVKYYITESQIEIGDAWCGPYHVENHFSELRDESHHFQESTVRYVIPFEFIDLFGTAMDKYKQLLENV